MIKFGNDSGLIPFKTAYKKGGELLWAIASKKNFIKVDRLSFSGSIPPKFERKLRRHKQRFGKINTTVVLDKDETLL